MLFMHTIDKVLAGTKTATSRLWKDDYVFSWSDYEEPNQVVLSQKAWEKGKIRKLYYVGQVVSVQPARGQKGVAKIRILELQKRDVRTYSYEDAIREGFDSVESFLRVWVSMHDKWLIKAMLADKYSNISSRAAINVPNRPAEYYTALFIRFELVQEGQS